MSGKIKVVAGLAALVVVATAWFLTGAHGPRPAATQESSIPTAGPRPGIAASRQLLDDKEGRPHQRPASPDDEGSAASVDAPPHTRPQSPNDLARNPAGRTDAGEPVAPEASANGPETLGAAERFEQTKRKALSDPDPHERARAVEALDSFDDAPILPVLARALDDPDPEVREAVADELGAAFDEPPLGLLGTALRDNDPRVRLAALHGIADSEDDARWPLIRSALEDNDEEVRAQAEEIIEAAGAGKE